MGKTTDYGFRSYEDFKRFMRGKQTRKLDNNTYLVDNHHNIEVQLHGHAILTVDEKTLVFSACGWNTVTTRNRLNRLPFGNFHQKDFTLHFRDTAISSHDKVIVGWNGEWLNEPETL